MIFFGPIHLGWQPVGQPEIRAPACEKLFDHDPAAVAMDDEAGAVGVMEHSGPPVLFTDAHAGLVGRKDGATQQAGADQARLLGEGLPAVVEHVHQRALADVEAEKVREQVRQALERDHLGEAQIKRKGPQVRTERRAWLKPLRRRRFEPLGAAGTHQRPQI